jgi:two-component system NarL family sensor kinase
MRPFLVIVLGLGLGIFSYAQDFSPRIINPYIDSLSEDARVDFIIENLYKLYSANLDNAVYQAEIAVSIAQQNNWKSREAYTLMCKGIANYLRGNYPTALDSFLKSTSLFDSLDDKSGVARVNNELAVFYKKNKEFDKASECLDKSEAAALEANDIDALGTSYSHRGVLLSQQGLYDEAKTYYDKVLEIRLQQKDSVGLGYVMLDIAEFLAFKGQLKDAFNWIEQSTIIRKAMGDDQGVAVNTVIIGEMYFGDEQYAKAIPYFEKTIDLAIPIGYTDLIKFSYGMLQQSYVEVGNFEKAYNYQSQQMMFQDSLLNVEKTKALAELQTKYETEKKEQQIALQQAQIETQQAQNQVSMIVIAGLTMVLILTIVILFLLKNRSRKKEELLVKQGELKLKEAEVEFSIKSQEKERARFAKDLHDGFGQMISILNLNLKSLESNPKDRQLLFESSTEVLDDMYKELKGICFNLMPQTLIQNGLPTAIDEFVSRINKAGQLRVETDFFGMEDRLSDVQEISFYRIVQEWVNNVIKYGEASHITVQLTRDNEEITLLIEDDGPGFDRNLLINSTKGHGWKNIRSRTNLIKGEIELDTEIGRSGSTLIIVTRSIEHRQEDSSFLAVTN